MSKSWHWTLSASSWLTTQKNLPFCLICCSRALWDPPLVWFSSAHSVLVCLCPKLFATAHCLLMMTQIWPRCRTVRHVGGAMRGAGAEQISVLVRTMVESKVSNNALRFFYSLGYKLDHELLKIGFAFRFQRGAPITVTVTSANKMPKLHATDEAVPVTPGIQMVEITAPTAGDNYNEVGAAVSSFCEYLAP